MMKFLAGFFREGVPESNMRLNVTIVILNACGLLWYGAKHSNGSVMTVAVTVLTLALGAKYAQKTKEATQNESQTNKE